MVRKTKSKSRTSKKAPEFNRSDILEAVEELNVLLDPDPEIDGESDVKELYSQLNAVPDLLEEDDDITEETQSLLDDIVASKGKFTINEDAEEEDDEEEEEEEEEDDVEEDEEEEEEEDDEEEEEEEPAPKKTASRSKAKGKGKGKGEDFSGMSMAALRKEAKSRGLKIPFGASKDSIITALETGEVPEAPAPPKGAKGKAKSKTKTTPKKKKEKIWTRAQSCAEAYKKRPSTVTRLLKSADLIHSKKGGKEDGDNKKTAYSMLRYLKYCGHVELDGDKITYLDE